MEKDTGFWRGTIKNNLRGDPAFVITAISNMWDDPRGILISWMFEVQIILFRVFRGSVSLLL